MGLQFTLGAGPPQDGTDQQRAWANSAVANTRYDFTSFALVVQVALHWAATVPGSDPDAYMFTDDLGTDGSGARSFIITIANWADDPTRSGKGANVRAYYEQSFIHQLAHILLASTVPTYVGDPASYFSGDFWRIGTDHAYGSSSDWSTGVWADSIEEAVCETFKCGLYTGTLIAPINRTNWTIDEGDPPLGAPPGTIGSTWRRFLNGFAYPAARHYEATPWRDLTIATDPAAEATGGNHIFGFNFAPDPGTWVTPTISSPNLDTEISYSGTAPCGGRTWLMHTGYGSSGLLAYMIAVLINSASVTNGFLNIYVGGINGHNDPLIPGSKPAVWRVSSAPSGPGGTNVSDGDWAAALTAVTKAVGPTSQNDGVEYVGLPDSNIGSSMTGRGLWVGVMAHANQDWETGYWMMMHAGSPRPDGDVPFSIPYFMQPFYDPTPSDPFADASNGKTLFAGPTSDSLTTWGPDAGSYQAYVVIDWRSGGAVGTPSSAFVSLGTSAGPSNSTPGDPPGVVAGGGFMFGGDYLAPYAPTGPYPYGLIPTLVVAGPGSIGLIKR